MIDVCVGAHDLPGFQAVFLEPGEDFLRVVSRVDHDGFFSFLITQNCAVALKPTDGEGFNDHRMSCAPSTLNVPVLAAPRFLKSKLASCLSSPGRSFCRTTSLSFSRTFPASSIYVASS